MSIKSTQLAKLTRNELLADQIQRVLRDTAIVWPLLMDISDRFLPGTKTATIPQSKSRTVGDTPSDGTEIADATGTVGTDVLTLDQFKTVSDYVYDTDQVYSAVDLKQDFYAEAPKDLADYIEAAAVAKLLSEASNHIQMSGSDDAASPVANARLTVDDIGKLAEQMTTAKMPKNGRKLLVSPKQARLLRKDSVIQNAAAFGNANAIQNGMIAKLEGFDIFECNNLTANQAVAFVEGAMVKAVAKEVAIDEERQSAKKRTFVSCDAFYGMKSLRGGSMIWRLDTSAS